MAADWEIVEVPTPPLEEGQLAVAVAFISLDPAMRGWIEDRPSYIPQIELGAVMRANGVGRVLESRNPRFAVGDRVTGMFGAREIAVSDGRGVRRIDTSMGPAPTWLGVLGGTGLTAYFGLLDVGALRPGETVVVSAAAGAVGGVVGQIAKIHGCRTIGIAGGRAKCDHVVGELGFDAAIDYREADVGAELGRMLDPEGLDVYFDNVGGDHLEAALDRLNSHGRVVLCGMSAQYNDTAPATAPHNLVLAINKRLRLEGLLVTDHHDLREQFVRAAAAWIRGGELRYRETVVAGLEDGVDAFLGMLRGENTGKMIVSLDVGAR